MMLLEPGQRMPAWLESAWLQRYLERQLNAEEEAWFEGYLLDKPDLVGRMNLDTDVRDGLADAGRNVSGAVEVGNITVGDIAPARGSKGSTVTTLRPGLANNRHYVPAFGLAASLILGIGLGWIGQGVTTRDGGLIVIASPTRIVYDVTREASARPRVEHSESKSPYVLIEIALPPGAEQVDLKSGTVEIRKLVPSSEGFVSFLVKRTDVRGMEVHLSYQLGSQKEEKSFNLADSVE